jgi:di/tricarboxylate transporter
MTLEIGLVLGILLVAIILFVTERFRVDVVALLVLSSLVVTGLVSPTEAVAGFANPAVVTVWAIFILSGALDRTGVATLLGQNVLRLAGQSETRLIMVLMLTSGLLSAFMNNIGVAAMFLPVTLDISRQTKIPPSRLLLPLLYGSLLGGMLTLISTPANILVSEALIAAGWEPFGIFDYTPAGLFLLGGGILFVLLTRRFLLPDHRPLSLVAGPVAETATNDHFELEEQLAVMTLPPDSSLAGTTLAESRIGEALGLTILGIRRGERRHMAPEPGMVLHGEDRLLVLGRLDRLEALTAGPNLGVASEKVDLDTLTTNGAGFAELEITTDSPYLGRTLNEANVREEMGVMVLAILRQNVVTFRRIQDMILSTGDRLLLYGAPVQLQDTVATPLTQAEVRALRTFDLSHCLLVVRVPAGSLLTGRSLVESRMANTYGLSVLQIQREGETIMLPGPETILAAGDVLIVSGEPRDLEIVRGLQGLVVDPRPQIDLSVLDSPTVSLTEVVLSPYTTLVGKTLRDLRFREKFGLSVLAIWRAGKSYRTGLANMPIQLGDALLVYGPRDRLLQLGREPDFLVLRGEAQPEPRRNKALPAGLIMLGVIAVTVIGWLPISVAAIIGATLMVIVGCLTMDEAYRYIEWKAVFLIAAMLPLGVAMEATGAAEFLAGGLMSLLGTAGPLVIMGGMFLLTLAATQFMPNPVVVVLMAPIMLTAAETAGVSPYPFMLTLAFAASSSFITPVAHAANVLIMGPGGYRFSDYVRSGIPLALVLLVITLLVVPLFWPF